MPLDLDDVIARMRQSKGKGPSTEEESNGGAIDDATNSRWDRMRKASRGSVRRLQDMSTHLFPETSFRKKKNERLGSGSSLTLSDLGSSALNSSVLSNYEDDEAFEEIEQDDADEKPGEKKENKQEATSDFGAIVMAATAKSQAKQGEGGNKMAALTSLSSLYANDSGNEGKGKGFKSIVKKATAQARAAKKPNSKVRFNMETSVILGDEARDKETKQAIEDDNVNAEPTTDNTTVSPQSNMSSKNNNYDLSPIDFARLALDSAKRWQKNTNKMLLAAQQENDGANEIVEGAKANPSSTSEAMDCATRWQKNTLRMLLAARKENDAANDMVKKAEVHLSSLQAKNGGNGCGATQ